MRLSIEALARRSTIMVLPAFLTSFIAFEARGTEGGQSSHRLLLELGADAALAIGTICEREIDMVGCASAQGAAGFSAQAGWLFAEGLSLGAFGAYQWAPNGATEGDQNGTTKPISETVLWMAAEGRWMPWSHRFSVMADLGAVRYHQDYHPYSTQTPGASASQWAPALGLGVAWRLLQVGWFSVAFDLRYWLTPFRSEPPAFTGDRTAKSLGTLSWFSLGLQFGVRP